MLLYLFRSIISMKSIYHLIFILSILGFTSCADPILENSIQDPSSAQQVIDGTHVVNVIKYASNSRSHQSSASYYDYLFLITQSRKNIYLYNLRSKEMLCTMQMDEGVGNSSTGGDLYHSNQATFGVDFYNSLDPFPLLYISQRAKEDLRCFVECYRILPFSANPESDYSSISAQLVQTIHFPKMTKENSLGNVNCVIDQDKRLMYTYSRNNNNHDKNYGICKISCFGIPNLDKSEVFLEDSDIIDSYQIDCSAINMQGGCIKDGLLYIGQGYKSEGIYMNVVDLSLRSLRCRIDLLKTGIEWEPEGCFVYEDRIMVSSNDNNIWAFQFLSLN